MKNQLIKADGIGTNIQTGNSIMVKNRIYTVTGIASRNNEGGGGALELPRVFTNIVTRNERGERVIFALAELVRVKAKIVNLGRSPLMNAVDQKRYCDAQDDLLFNGTNGADQKSLDVFGFQRTSSV